jgi:hypothetical protein
VTLRAGVHEAVRRPSVRGPLLLAALLPTLTAIDEYVPLLGPAYRMPTVAVPLLLLGITLSAAVGTWAAGRWWAARPARTAAAIGVAAVALALSGIAARPAGFAGVALGFGLLQFGIASARIRLQHAITGPARATVTSVSELVDEVGSLAVFVACEVIGGLVSIPVLIALFALPTALLAAATPRWLTAAGSPEVRAGEVQAG